MEVYANPGPDGARLPGRHCILIGPLVRVGAKRAVWVERIVGQKPTSGIFLVEQIDQPREQFEILRDVIRTAQIDYRVTGNPTRALDECALAIGAAGLIG